MKKLLIGSMIVALFVADAHAGLFGKLKNKIVNKVGISTQESALMGGEHSKELNDAAKVFLKKIKAICNGESLLKDQKRTYSKDLDNLKSNMETLVNFVKLATGMSVISQASQQSIDQITSEVTSLIEFWSKKSGVSKLSEDFYYAVADLWTTVSKLARKGIYSDHELLQICDEAISKMKNSTWLALYPGTTEAIAYIDKKYKSQVASNIYVAQQTADQGLAQPITDKEQKKKLNEAIKVFSKRVEILCKGDYLLKEQKEAYKEDLNSLKSEIRILVNFVKTATQIALVSLSSEQSIIQITNEINEVMIFWAQKPGVSKLSKDFYYAIADLWLIVADLARNGTYAGNEVLQRSDEAISKIKGAIWQALHPGMLEPEEYIDKKYKTQVSSITPIASQTIVQTESTKINKVHKKEINFATKVFSKKIKYLCKGESLSKDQKKAYSKDLDNLKSNMKTLVNFVRLATRMSVISRASQQSIDQITKEIISLMEFWSKKDGVSRLSEDFYYAIADLWTTVVNLARKGIYSDHELLQICNEAISKMKNSTWLALYPGTPEPTVYIDDKYKDKNSSTTYKTDTASTSQAVISVKPSAPSVTAVTQTASSSTQTATTSTNTARASTRRRRTSTSPTITSMGSALVSSTSSTSIGTSSTTSSSTSTVVSGTVISSTINPLLIKYAPAMGQLEAIAGAKPSTPPQNSKALLKRFAEVLEVDESMLRYEDRLGQVHLIDISYLIRASLLNSDLNGQLIQTFMDSCSKKLVNIGIDPHWLSKPSNDQSAKAFNWIRSQVNKGIREYKFDTSQKALAKRKLIAARPWDDNSEITEESITETINKANNQLKSPDPKYIKYAKALGLLEAIAGAKPSTPPPSDQSLLKRFADILGINVNLLICNTDYYSSGICFRNLEEQIMVNQATSSDTRISTLYNNYSRELAKVGVYTIHYGTPSKEAFDVLRSQSTQVLTGYIFNTSSEAIKKRKEIALRPWDNAGATSTSSGVTQTSTTTSNVASTSTATSTSFSFGSSTSSTTSTGTSASTAATTSSNTASTSAGAEQTPIVQREKGHMLWDEYVEKPVAGAVIFDDEEELIYAEELKYLIGKNVSFPKLKKLQIKGEYRNDGLYINTSDDLIKGLAVLCANAPNLEDLTINYGLSGVLTSEICKLKKLTSLNLQDNSLTGLPSEIGQLTNLKTLVLRNNPITDLPNEIGGLKSLISLDLCKNQLTTLPAGIGGLTNLTSLDLSANRHERRGNGYTSISYTLKSLPNEIGNLVNLTTLNLKENGGLTALPNTIGNLKNLTSLDVSSCRLTSLPEGIGGLTNLTSLNLTLNFNLTTLPNTIGNLRKRQQ